MLLTSVFVVMASMFLHAMAGDTMAQTKVGVNGSDVYTEEGVGHPLVALFTMLVRGGEAGMKESLAKILAGGGSVYMKDLFVLAFQTRDIRGGKGERDLFTGLLVELLVRNVHIAEAMIRLVPEYGCWKDLWSIWDGVGAHSRVDAGIMVRSTIDAVVCEQFRKDWVTLDRDGERAALSLLAKWLPREDSANEHLAFHFAQKLFPSTVDMDDKRRAYRKACSEMNAHLKTVEVHMCDGTWAEIAPGAVPGRTMHRNKRAFLNLVSQNEYHTAKTVSCSRRRIHKKGTVRQRDSGTLNDLRYPCREDRMKCRENFLGYVEKAKKGEVKVKGADVIMPHELVVQLRTNMSLTTSEVDLIEAQWKSIRERVVSEGGIRGTVVMSDFSGSMEGIPMNVSLALGILISEINDEAFKDHVLSFDSKPTWIRFQDQWSLKEKIAHAIQAPWGGSTNFQAACDLVLKRLVEYKVPPSEAPKDLLVLTDMGFDQACGLGGGGGGGSYASVNKSAPWQTHLQMIRGAFAAHGYTVPRIVLWNLRAAYKDFHATAHEDGVVMLSGWSPAVLKAIQTGVDVRTPYQGLRELLDAPRYDAVRTAFGGGSARG